MNLNKKKDLNLFSKENILILNNSMQNDFDMLSTCNSGVGVFLFKKWFIETYKGDF